MRLTATRASVTSGGAVALWTPSQLSGLQLWLDASDTTTITESSGSVSQWDDKSGNENHVSQGTAVNQPTTGTRTINGLNVLDFDGDMLFTTDSVVSGNPNLGIALLILYDTNGGALTDRTIQIGAGAGSTAGITGGTNGYSWRFNDGTEEYGTVSTGTALIQIGVRPSGGDYESSQMFIDGTEETATSLSNGTPNISAGASIGGGQSGNTALGTISNAINGAIGEAIAVEDNSTNTRQKIEGYLAHKWGLTGSLPSDHPYKGLAPTV